MNKKDLLYGAGGFAIVLVVLLFFTARKRVDDEGLKLRPSIAKVETVEEKDDGKDTVGGIEIPIIKKDVVYPKKNIPDPLPSLNAPKYDAPIAEVEKPAPKAEKPAAAASIPYASILSERQSKKPRWLGMDWKRSIVDLLKLSFLPADRDERDYMSEHLGYDGPDGQYERNVWLHRQMRKGFEKGEIPIGDEETKTNDWQYK